MATTVDTRINDRVTIVLLIGIGIRITSRILVRNRREHKKKGRGFTAAFLQLV
jgi:hypothetical protein